MGATNAYAGRGLHGQIVEEIGTRIIGGEYKPGDPLLADALERDFEVSKTVVREALKVLSAKGLVESRQKRGTLVRPRSEWSLLDSDVLRWQRGVEPDIGFLENLAEVRAIIEPAAVRLAAQRRTAADLDELDDALAAMGASAKDADAVVAADVRFHRALLHAAHNELLTAMGGVLAAGLTARDQFVHHGPHRDSLGSHRDIVDAVRAKNADDANRAIDRLLAQSSRDLRAARRAARRSPRT